MSTPDDEWSARVYGPGWPVTKQRYWASRFTPKRCWWCLASRRATPLQLNHLMYSRVRPDGQTPLWTLLPLCPRCHSWETVLTRLVRPHLGFSKRQTAHLIVTLAGWVASRGLAAAVVFAFEAALF